MILHNDARQRIMTLLTGTPLSSHQLAQLLGMPERQVEDHLTHIENPSLAIGVATFLLETFAPSGTVRTPFAIEPGSRAPVVVPLQKLKPLLSTIWHPGRVWLVMMWFRSCHLAGNGEVWHTDICTRIRPITKGPPL